MTTFQVLALVFFGVTAAAAYGKEILAAVRRYVSAPSRPGVVPPPASPITTNGVHDMITVADMRDRLHALGCTEGVDACTYLLKVLVEFKYPQG